MKPRTIGRIIAALVVGVALGGAMHLEEVKRGQMGREEFLAKQAIRFDKHYAKPDSVAIDIIVCVFMASAVFGIYELIAFGASKVLKSVGGGDERS